MRVVKFIRRHYPLLQVLAVVFGGMSIMTLFVGGIMANGVAFLPLIVTLPISIVSLSLLLYEDCYRSAKRKEEDGWE